MNNCFILLAAGQSKRFKSKKPKQYVLYRNKPLYEHSIDKILNSGLFKYILLVVENKNYQSLMAVFSLRKKGELIGYILPGKNYYPVSKMITTEAGIYHDWLKDIYITLGNEEDSTWSIKIYLNPLVSFIWIGVCIMIFSGFIAIFKK